MRNDQNLPNRQISSSNLNGRQLQSTLPVHNNYRGRTTQIDPQIETTVTTEDRIPIIDYTVIIDHTVITDHTTESITTIITAAV